MTKQSQRCDREDSLVEYAFRTLCPRDRLVMQQHVSECVVCREELAAMRPVVDAFVLWPVDVLRPSTSLWGRLAERIAAETGAEPVTPADTGGAADPIWREVAPGISCKLLATDTERERVSMLVRLAPGTSYPPHTHAGVEELHLLHGELWINDRKLYPGDYNRAEQGTTDSRVWSETGCTCVLITSPRDTIAYQSPRPQSS